MKKKYVSLTTLIFFSVFTFSCTLYVNRGMRREKIEKVSSRKKQKYRILSVTKTNGERIEFYKDEPGKIVSNTIVGSGWIKAENLEIERKNVKMIKRLEDRPDVLITKDGRVLEFQSLKKEKDKIILGNPRIRKDFTIPFSEIELVNLKRPTHILSIVVGLGLVVGIIVFIATIYSVMEE